MSKRGREAGYIRRAQRAAGVRLGFGPCEPISSLVAHIKKQRPDLADLGRINCLRAFVGPSPEHVPTQKQKNMAAKRAGQSALPYEATDAFLASFEWRRVRMMALKQHGARCQCCGSTAADGVRIHVDHVKPRKLFPQLALSLDNLQVLCEVCNHGKGNWDETDWRP